MQERSAVSMAAVHGADDEVGQMLPALWLIQNLSVRNDRFVYYHDVGVPLFEPDSIRQRCQIDRKRYPRARPELTFISCANPGDHDSEIFQRGEAYGVHGIAPGGGFRIAIR